MVVLKVFNDESGKGDPRTFVMAGFVARAETWAAFEDDWKAVLALPPAIPHFHMVEAVAAGDFGRIRALADVIRKHQLVGLVVLIYAPDYDKIVRDQLGPRFDNPYVFGLFRQIEQAVQWQIDHGLDEQMDFIFDEQDHESDFVQSIWAKLAKRFPDSVQRRVVNRPIHLDDKDSPGLQAADFLAWIFRRAPEPEFPKFLIGILADVTVRQDQWTNERLADLVDFLKRRIHDAGHLSFHDFARASQNRDILYGQMNRAAISRAKSGQTVGLLSIPAKGIGKFLLVDNCPRSNSPHLHRRSGDQCLAEVSA